jgi:hypothetical protein
MKNYYYITYAVGNLAFQAKTKEQYEHYSINYILSYQNIIFIEVELNDTEKTFVRNSAIISFSVNP